MAALAVITSREQMPDWARVNLDEIESMGFHWSYIPQLPLADLELRVQVRDLEALAPETEVQKYARGLTRGDQFPPVVVSADGYLIDGATRTAAARACGYTAFPAIRLSENYENAPEILRQQFLVLGAALNGSNGRNMSSQNLDRLIEEVLNPNKTYEQLAMELHVATHQVIRVAQRKRGSDRLARLGLGEDDLGVTHLGVLGAKHAKHTDQVVKAAAELARDSGMAANDLRTMLGRAEELGTDEEKLRFIATERQSRAAQIAAGPRAALPKSVILRRALGYILANQLSPGEFCELTPGLVTRHKNDLHQTIKVLQAVLECQYDLERQAGQLPDQDQ
jgi:hypothetical protein